MRIIFFRGRRALAVFPRNVNIISSSSGGYGRNANSLGTLGTDVRLFVRANENVQATGNDVVKISWHIPTPQPRTFAVPLLLRYAHYKLLLLLLLFYIHIIIHHGVSWQLFNGRDVNATLYVIMTYRKATILYFTTRTN